MKFSERKKLIDRQSFVAQYISLAMFVTGESKSVHVWRMLAVSDGPQVVRCFSAVTTCCQHSLADALSLGSESEPIMVIGRRNSADELPSGFFNQATEDAVFSNVIDLLFNVAAFVYIGALIPFGDFNNYAIHVRRKRRHVITVFMN